MDGWQFWCIFIILFVLGIFVEQCSVKLGDILEILKAIREKQSS